MAKKLRAGITGMGWPAWQHIRGYKKSADVELVALCGQNKHKLDQTADQYEIPDRYQSFDEMLERGGLDIVSICTPNYLHAGMTIKALDKGKHVLCEKPMATSVSDAERMIEASRRSTGMLMIAHQQRFSPQAQHLKKLISAGDFGEIYHIRAYWVRRRGIPGLGGWFTRKEKAGGGALLDIGVHLMDLSMWFLNFPDPLQVISSWGSKFGVKGKGASVSYPAVNNEKDFLFDVDDYVFAQINFAGGSSLQLQCSWAGHVKGEEFNMEIWGERGGAKLFPLEIYTEQEGEPVDNTPLLQESDPFEEEIADFITSIKNGTTPSCPPEESVKTIELVEMIYKSGIPEKRDALEPGIAG